MTPTSKGCYSAWSRSVVRTENLSANLFGFVSSLNAQQASQGFDGKVDCCCAGRIIHSARRVRLCGVVAKCACVVTDAGTGLDTGSRANRVIRLAGQQAIRTSRKTHQRKCAGAFWLSNPSRHGHFGAKRRHEARHCAQYTVNPLSRCSRARRVSDRR